MILAKMAIWLVLYPISLVGYIVVSIIDLLNFLFNSPVDIWNIISNAIDGTEEATAEE